MSTRMIRTAAAMVALLFGMLAFSVSPIAAQDSTPAATPGAEQPVMVGQTEVSWAGNWELDPSSSMDDQIVLSQVDMETASIMLATYGEFADDTVDSPDAAIDAFATAFFEGAGAGEVVESGSGELDNGAVWKSYSLDLQGIPLTFLVTASETADGEYVVSTLTATSANFQEAIEASQADISLNGEPVFLDGIDAAAVASATPGASPEATPAS